ncbi:MAG: hypothetical protein ACFFBP_16580 [Promethearchaeota archaeon]
MEVLINFSQSLKAQILEYYKKTYKYIEDLLAYKEINLTATILDKSQEEMKEMVVTMIKVTKVSLKTIGVPENQIKKNEKQINDIASMEGVNYISIADYFDEIKIILNKFLFNSIIDYLIDEDINQLNTAELFDLLPEHFKEQIVDFKSTNIISKNIKKEIKNNIEKIGEIIDLSTLEMRDRKQMGEIPKIEPKETPIKNEMQGFNQADIDRLDLVPPPQSSKVEKKIVSPKENLFVFSDNKPGEIIREMEPSPIRTPIIEEKIEEPQPKEDIKITTIDEIPKNFLDFYGKFPKLDNKMINKFNINSVNLINSRVANPSEFLDLETLFYYIAILKMIGIGFPFSSIEIIEVAKNYINDKVFSSSRINAPDPINILFGLALFSELNLLERKDIIDIHKIRDFLTSEFAHAMPEKLDLNFHTLLALRLMERRGISIIDSKEIIDQIIKLSLSSLDEREPITDIFYQLASIKLFENQGKKIPSTFKGMYMKELKNLIQKNGSINNLITDSAKMLLIIDLLDLKQKEKSICNKLIEYMIDTPVFFDSRSLNPEFNWKQHKLAYVIELRMLFWALLACSQYAN